MKSLKLLHLAILAIFAISAIASASASAAPKLLNTEGKEVATKVTSNEASETHLKTLGSGTEVLCKSQKSESTLTGSSGPFHIEFKECSALIGGINAGKCTGLGDATTGVILVLGTATLVFDSLTTLGVAVLFGIEPVHFECKSIVTILETVTGNVLCLITPLNSLSTTSTLKCEEENGDPKETKYWNSAGTETTASLLTSENEKTAVDSGQGGTVKLTNAPSTEIMG